MFTGGVPGDELPAHHAMADVFAMPCRTRGAGLDVEGLGIVYLEASATGVPVVAGESGGAPETVRDGETGLVVDGWDVGAIAAAVGDLLADPRPGRRDGRGGPALGRRQLAVGRPRPRATVDRQLHRMTRRQSLSYSASMSLANFSATTLRLTFSVGVSSPVSSVKSTGRMRNLRIASAFDTAWLASLTARSISATQVGVVGQVADRRAGVLAVAFLPAGERLGVDGDERGDERLGVADAHRLADQRMRAQPVLQQGGGDVLAARGHDDLLLAADDGQEAVVVDRAEVAGVEPAVGEDRAWSPPRCASSR